MSNGTDNDRPPPGDQDAEWLAKLYRRRDDDLRAAHNRSLPYAETILRDRWERAERLGFGKGASIYNSATVFGDVYVGDSTWIGPSVVLDGSEGLSIGSYCSISAGVQIYTHDSVFWAITGGKAAYRRASTRIGNRCYIGPMAVIAAGVAIGNGCVVATNSFIKDDVPSDTIVGGTPARVLGRVVFDMGEPYLVYDHDPT